ncbi:MAG: hypothetical protein M3Y56_14755, partial [Armatimonadota bacterium]|nr:hypothetical protein [Armatimonadota bacterium]
MSPDELLDQLGYSRESEYWITEDKADEVGRDLWRAARNSPGIDVCGSYVFRTSSKNNPILPPRPAVHVVTAATDKEARAIRKKLWNLGTAPFLIVIVLGRVRVYRGFDYDLRKDGTDWFLDKPITPSVISEALQDFYAVEIDSGRIWETQAINLTPGRRV